MSIIETVKTGLAEKSITLNESDYKKTGYHYEAILNNTQVRQFAEVMIANELFLDFVTAIHVKPNSLAVYQFGCFTEPLRINAKAEVSSDNSIDTISDIFHGANWHERETFDFYGLHFTGHPDLRNLILDDSDIDLNPLLKKDDKIKEIADIRWVSVSEKDSNKKNTSE
jgi:NADH-quinone oxidoreductase subunit C